MLSAHPVRSLRSSQSRKRAPDQFAISIFVGTCRQLIKRYVFSYQSADPVFFEGGPAWQVGEDVKPWLFIHLLSSGQKLQVWCELGGPLLPLRRIRHPLAILHDL